MVLDINPKDVKFYEYGFLETDSLNQLPDAVKIIEAAKLNNY